MDVEVILFCAPVTDAPAAAWTCTAYVVAGVMAAAVVESAHGAPVMVRAERVAGGMVPPVRVSVRVESDPEFTKATLHPDTLPVPHCIFNNEITT